MSVMSKYNRGYKFNIDTEGFKFFKLKDLFDKNNPDKVFELKGLVIFNSKYGDSFNAILEDRFVNLPSHLGQTIKDMINDDEVVNAINAGKAGMVIRTYEDTKYNKGLCYGVDFLDIE